jgi:hypothetical protein
MALRRRSWSILLLAVFIGALLGSALGELLGAFLPQGVVKEFFLRAVQLGVDPERPLHLNLAFLILTLGGVLKVNILSILGMALAAYIMK